MAHGLTPSSMQSAEAYIQFLDGLYAGKCCILTRAVTTIGKPGTQVAGFIRGARGYQLVHLGQAAECRPILNGEPLTTKPVYLKNKDHILLAGVSMQFHWDV